MQHPTPHDVLPLPAPVAVPPRVYVLADNDHGAIVGIYSVAPLADQALARYPKQARPAVAVIPIELNVDLWVDFAIRPLGYKGRHRR